MSFLHPEFLYYSVVPVLIFFVFILTRKSSQEGYFSEEVMQKLRVSANTLTLKTRNWLFFVITLLILFALSGPIIDEGTIEVKAKSADIMIALDISDSMLGEDVYPNRLKLAKQKALELLKLAPNERMGVIGFAKNSYLVSPLSFDSNAVAFLLRELNTDSITEKGTNFLSMLEVVDKSIKKESKKYLLILSDGGDSKDFSKEIAYAKEKNIVVFVLALGTSKGAPIKREDGSFLKQNGEVLISKLNENIADLATKTGGVYIESVNSNADIKTMLKEIEAHSEKKELKSQEIKRYIALFYYPLALALFLLLIATSSKGRKIEKNALAVPLLLSVFGFSSDAQASVTDFMLLDKAKKAYETQEYEKAQTLYDEYSNRAKSSELEYNIANTLYKQKKYKAAQAAYEKIHFKEPTKQAKNYANLGNAYVKSKENLQKALEAYESSLKLQEDKEVRENLEAVKKAIQEQKKQDKKKDDKKDKSDNKDKKSKDDKKDKEDKSDSKDKKSKDEKKSDKKSKDEKKKEQEKSKKDSDKEKHDKEKNEKEKKKKDEAKELKNKKSSKENAKAQKIKSKMSDEEEKKWLKQLSKQQSTFLYKLNDNNKFEDNTDEKPW